MQPGHVLVHVNRSESHAVNFDSLDYTLLSEQLRFYIAVQGYKVLRLPARMVD